MYPRHDVLDVAHGLMAEFAPACERAGIAGSLRRGKDEVKDLEIVALPRWGHDLFEQLTPDAPTELDAVLARLMFEKRLTLGSKNGRRYKQLVVNPLGIKLDLFIVLPPVQYGVQLVIRTGPASFSKRFVTPRKWGGLLPSHLKVRDGAIWNKEYSLETPDEASVFAILGIEWIDPEDRQ